MSLRVITVIAIVVLAGALIGVSVYGLQRMNALYEDIAQKNIQLLDYADLVARQKEELEAHKEFIRVLRSQSNQSAYNLSHIEAMVAQATQTIGDIKKLEEADRELLMKYSKVYFLNEHYEPESRTALPRTYTANDKEVTLLTAVVPFAIRMFEAMERDGLSPRVVSGYRSFDYQGDVKHRTAVVYGEGTANQFVADQGYSEHQLGTTIDVIQEGGTLDGFEKTPEYEWLQNNAHTYGFVLSYPQGNAYYAFEPWHWRFVGVALATKLHDEGKYFYDIPQREIDSYRLKMFE